jgi:nitrite reductase (NADH) small subunit/3-phenylpropionate/trans-cinnamate dioxygenase ferredoxin subunit
MELDVFAMGSVEFDESVRLDLLPVKCMIYFTHIGLIRRGRPPPHVSQFDHTSDMSDAETSRANFVTVAKVGEIPEGEGRSFQVGDRLVAVFLHEGQYLAIDDLCPHMGASLGGGYLDDEGVVTCPWHAWRFCVRDGKWADNPRLAIDTFDVRVTGNEVQVSAHPRSPAAATDS